MLNHIVIMGRLARDPELRRTGSGIAVASFTVGVERDYAQDGKKEMDWIECVAWRQTGEFVSKYFSKGKMIVVKGRLQIRSYTDKEGNKRKAAEVVADNCYFGETKRDSEPSTGSTGYANTGSQYGGYGGGYAPPDYGGSNYNPPQYGGGNYAYIEEDDAQLPFTT